MSYSSFEMILRDLLNGRDAEELTTTEAKRIINEFYFEVTIRTIGERNQSKIDYMSQRILDKYGLGFLALALA